MIYYFATREEARQFCRDIGTRQTRIKSDKSAPKGRRWSV